MLQFRKLVQKLLVYLQSMVHCALCYTIMFIYACTGLNEEETCGCGGKL